MCRNIKTLFNFEPPVTDEEIRAASLQFVRKVSGFNKPSKANEDAFLAAVDEVAQLPETFCARWRRTHRRGTVQKRRPGHGRALRRGFPREPFATHRATPSPSYGVWQPLLWATAGLLYGFGVWHVSEKRYVKYEREASSP